MMNTSVIVGFRAGLYDLGQKGQKTPQKFAKNGAIRGRPDGAANGAELKVFIGALSNA